MTAEEKLMEWYNSCAGSGKEPTNEMVGQGIVYAQEWGVLIAPEQIDLIANLAVERLRNVLYSKVD